MAVIISITVVIMTTWFVVRTRISDWPFNALFANMHANILGTHSTSWTRASVHTIYPIVYWPCALITRTIRQFNPVNITLSNNRNIESWTRLEGSNRNIDFCLVTPPPTSHYFYSPKKQKTKFAPTITTQTLTEKKNSCGDGVFISVVWNFLYASQKRKKKISYVVEGFWPFLCVKKALCARFSGRKAGKKCCITSGNEKI